MGSILDLAGAWKDLMTDEEEAEMKKFMAESRKGSRFKELQKRF